MVDQMNCWIHSGGGFVVSFDLHDLITDPDPDHPKERSLRLAKQQLRTCITLFCTFLCRRCTTTTWKFLISRIVEDVNTRQRLSFSFPELLYTLLEFNSRKNCQHLTNWTRWNKRDKVWSSATSLCKWRFRSRRRPCCLSSWLVSLSKYFFQRRTSTGSGLSALLSSGFA